MEKITGSGAPTKETAGYAGAIYEDTNTGKQYICTFSCVIGDTTDCEWEETDIKSFPEKTENKNISNRHKDYAAYGKNRK